MISSNKFLKFIIFNIGSLFIANSQTNYIENSYSIPRVRIIKEFENFIDSKPIYESIKIDSLYYNYSFNAHLVRNNGHSNIDNNAEIFSLGKNYRLISGRFSLINKWIIIEAEPFLLTHNNIFHPQSIEGNNTFRYTNNHTSNYEKKIKSKGFRQSLFALHYNGFGIGYGSMSHWWSPGFHSALALSSNAPSQESYIFGNFKNFKIKNLTFGFQALLMPYLNSKKDEIYFTGLRTNITYYSNPIISTGFNRTFLSGNFEDTFINDKSIDYWSKEDALKLIISPLFGQAKRGLSYSIPGTPGFDIWDELLSAYLKIIFPKENLEIYVDLASDDSRGNFSDLKAHWDHTLAYQLGLKKYYKKNKISYLIGIEYLTTRRSNTFNRLFYRADSNSPNYYLREIFDYFTYKNRRMGAHSGSSSEDMFFLFGIFYNDLTYFFSYNKEIHGINSMEFPELKNEFSITVNYKTENNQNFFITLENERINNFTYRKNLISDSGYIWIGYSYTLK